MFIFTIALVLIITGIFLAGPRVSLKSRVTITELPEDLDVYLKNTEDRFTDITPGAEKTIVWADSTRKHKTRYAFVYLHGFSATRQESVPVPGDIANHFESNIYYARLAGNGRRDDAMANGSVQRWVNDASEALSIAACIGEETIVIGCSTGASLGWWIAHQEQFKGCVRALVFFSPNFGVKDRRANLMLLPWGGQLARAIIGEYRTVEVSSDAQERYWACRYPVKALLPLMGIVKLARQYLPSRLNLPVFVLYSPQDDTVDPKKIEKFYTQLTGYKRTLVIDDPDRSSKHVLVGEILAPENNAIVTQAVIRFIEELPIKQEASLNSKQGH